MRLFLVAGEPSGDRLGAALIDGLRRLDGDLDLSGGLHVLSFVSLIGNSRNPELR